MPQNSQGYIVDLRGVHDRGDLHDSLSRDLPLPEWYGRNLDALYDVLTDPVLGNLGEVRLTGCTAAGQALGGYFRAFLKVCRAAEEENPELHFVIAEETEQKL